MLERLDENKVGRIMVPGPYDVLLGRGKFCQEHIGNVRYRHLVEKYVARYDEAAKDEKTVLSMMIIRMIKESTGRFLKEDGAAWVEADDSVARTKVSQFFRSARLALRNSGKTGQKTSKDSTTPCGSKAQSRPRVVSPVSSLNNVKDVSTKRSRS
jgi:hypothetical protein